MSDPGYFSPTENLPTPNSDITETKQKPPNQTYQEESNRFDFKCVSCSSKNCRQKELISSETVAQNNNKHKKNRIIMFTLFAICMMVCLALTFVIISGNYRVWQTERAPLNHISGLEVQNILVRTLREYNAQINKYTPTSLLFVNIRILDPSDWPVGLPVLKSMNVRMLHIQGKLHINKLIELLSTVPLLDELVIDNADSDFCVESQQLLTDIHGTYWTMSLNNFHFTNIDSSCEALFSKIQSKVRFHRLESIVIQNSALTFQTAAFVQKMCNDHKTSLKHIEVRNSTGIDNVFLQHTTIYPNVIRLVYDVNFDGNLGLVFPNLEYLSLGQTPKALNQLKSICGIKSLKKLSLTLEIPANEYQVSLAFLHEEFPFLESADITLTSTSCPPSSNFFGKSNQKLITNHRILSDVLLENLRIITYCKLTYD